MFCDSLQHFRKLFPLSIVTLITLIPSLCLSQPSQDPLTASYETAQKLFQEGKDEAAAAAFRAVLTDTRRAQTALLGDRATRASANQEERLRVYAQVLADGHKYMGLIAARQQRFEEASEHFKQVQSLQPHFPDVNFNLGLALFEAERYRDATDPLEQALKETPTKPLLKRLLGVSYFHQEQYEKSVRYLEEARLLYPDDAQVLLALGTSLVRTQRHRKSSRNY